jgi:hypothetical protein
MHANAERTLRVIEPNLAGPSGHYAEFVRALSARGGAWFDRIEVAADARAGTAFTGDAAGARIAVRPVFGAGGGGWRRELAEERDALRATDPTLLLTARAVHALALEALARTVREGAQSLGRVRLYFHWCERSRAQRAMMAAAPRVRAHAVAIAPTPTIVQFLREQGWERVVPVAYPILAPATVPPPAPFTHLLMAGAARMNKGLELVAGLAERYAAQGRATRLVVQTTPKRVSGRRGGREEHAVARLLASGAPGLEASDRAPPSAEYGARFVGALVLAPYDPAAFADNVSGVVLDGLLRGAPVVASAGSWPGRVVERFGAGAVFHDRTAEAFAQAIERVLEDWEGACARAQRAARELAAEHDPAHLARALATGA